MRPIYIKFTMEETVESDFIRLLESQAKELPEDWLGLVPLRLMAPYLEKFGPTHDLMTIACDAISRGLCEPLDEVWFFGQMLTNDSTLPIATFAKDHLSPKAIELARKHPYFFPTSYTGAAILCSVLDYKTDDQSPAISISNLIRLTQLLSQKDLDNLVMMSHISGRYFDNVENLLEAARQHTFFQSWRKYYRESSILDAVTLAFERNLYHQACVLLISAAPHERPSFDFPLPESVWNAHVLKLAELLEALEHDPTEIVDIALGKAYEPKLDYQVTDDVEPTQDSSPAPTDIEPTQDSSPIDIEQTQDSSPAPTDIEQTQDSSSVLVDTEQTQDGSPVLVDTEQTQDSSPVLAGIEQTQDSSSVPANNEPAQDSSFVHANNEPAQGSSPESAATEPAQGSSPEPATTEPTQGSSSESAATEPTQGSSSESAATEPTQDSPPKPLAIESAVTELA